ncbi:hypothetical protein [Nostoc sp.]|uniref:hypothetical protein n=1 Tax=Nostoc sp. TaxID=1180 RepID=UPI002FFB092F
MGKWLEQAIKKAEPTKAMWRGSCVNQECSPMLTPDKLALRRYRYRLQIGEESLSLPRLCDERCFMTSRSTSTEKSNPPGFKPQ